MAKLKRISVLHTTSKEDNAGTDAGFLLIVKSGASEVAKDFPDLSGDDRKKGQHDEYEIDVAGDNLDSDDIDEIKMRIAPGLQSSDGWLPESIWVLGETESNAWVVLGAHPKWNGGWFDSGDNAAGPNEHRLSN